MKFIASMLGVLALTISTFASANAQWDGTYYAEWNNGLGNASETDVVSGNNVSGEYFFSGPYGGQHFLWSGVLTAHDSSFATFIGGGRIVGDFLGTAFDTNTSISGFISCESLGCYLSYSNSAFDIQATTFLQPVAVVPEPETYGMLLAGLGLISFMARRRKM